MHPEDDKISVKTLFPFDPQTGCEIFLLELLPGCEHLSPAHKDGVVEHIVCVEGEIEILVNGMWNLVKKLEELRFNANQPHGYRNTTPHKARIVDLIHYRPQET